MGRWLEVCHKFCPHFPPSSIHLSVVSSARIYLSIYVEVKETEQLQKGNKVNAPILS